MVKLKGPDGENIAPSYQERLKQKRAMESLKGQGPPLGGAPPIPAGSLERNAMPQPEMDFQEGIENQRLDPKEVPAGVGAGYAINQALVGAERPMSIRQAKAAAAKRGPQQGPVSDETRQLLEHVQRQQNGEEEERPVKEQLEDAEQEMLEEQAFGIDFQALAAAQNTLLDPRRKKTIEERLEDLDIADLVTKSEIVQRVPVIPGKLEFTFRTLTQRENLWCMRYVYEFPGSQRYVETLFDTCKMACVLTALNGKPLPEHRDKVGTREETIDKQLFENKMSIIASWPVQLIGDAGVQCNWFNDRVNALFNEGLLKNG